MLLAANQAMALFLYEIEQTSSFLAEISIEKSCLLPALKNQDVLGATPVSVDGVMKTNSIHKSLQQEEFQVVDKSAKCLQKDDVVFACLHNL